ncbi:DUF1127 domain-containing protein [Lichenibacterium dinghuense]|uniref:DUF1127 domain-containing protein n=1 Tax=Lichenibacterium dinghuense TaxID=2895977 RepID=UPI00281569D4|nr:DUF1127 domain-containing protein [Lichenibacterium sp. 6Y81]
MLNFIASWRREREAIRELSRLSDRELADLGLCRSDIRGVVEEMSRAPAPEGTVARSAREPVGTMAPSWGTHARRSVAA